MTKLLVFVQKAPVLQYFCRSFKKFRNTSAIIPKSSKDINLGLGTRTAPTRAAAENKSRSSNLMLLHLMRQGDVYKKEPSKGYGFGGASCNTFGDGVALVEGVEGGVEGVEADEFDDLAEAREVEDGVAHGLGVLADLVEAVRLEERVPRRRLVEEVERHRHPTPPPRSKELGFRMGRGGFAS